MERTAEAMALTCHNFSDIRRRPLVIGKLDQVRLPFVVTMPQLAVGAITFGLLFLTRPVWGAIMSDRLHIVTFVVVPIVVAQQVSRTSIEGRTVSKAALGFFRLWLAPTRGEINGNRRRPAVTTRVQLQPLLPQAPLDGQRARSGRRQHRTNRRSDRARAARTDRRSPRAETTRTNRRTPGAETTRTNRRTPRAETTRTSYRTPGTQRAGTATSSRRTEQRRGRRS